MVTLNEYMSRERIQLTEGIVNENVIKVANEHTRYINIERMEYTNLKDLQKDYKRIYKLLKENKVKIGYSGKFSSQLTEWIKSNEYENQYKVYTDNFDQLVELWTDKLEQGLYMGTSDDYVLNEVIKPLTHDIERMLYTTGIFDKVADIKRRLKEIDENINSYDKFCKVYL